MKYINLNSKKGLVNLFADYIVKEFSHNTMIQVSDCGAFFLVKGKTDKEEYVDLNEIKKTFLSDNKNNYQFLGLENINIIDIIEYDTEILPKDRWHSFYPTERPIYTQSVIDRHEDLINTINSLNEVNGRSVIESEEEVIGFDYYEYPSMIITSEFPYGYGLDTGRLGYYYSEYIVNHLFNITNSSSIDFRFSSQVDDDMEVKIDISLYDSLLPNEYIKSMVLDVFNFDVSELKNELQSYDLLDDLKDPFGKKPWLVKDMIGDIVVI
jgi:hypothetical protein